jgi:uncharacterized protein YndB with AHSA1/START domain
MSEPIVVEVDLNAPLHRVWESITQPAQMARWFFDAIRDFRPDPGFETEFLVVAGPGREFLHRWKIRQAQAPNHLSYDWSYGGYPGASIVEWELRENKGRTRLRLTHSGGHSFPQDVPEFQRKNCIGGWQYFLQDRLVNYLSGESAAGSQEAGRNLP